MEFHKEVERLQVESLSGLHQEAEQLRAEKTQEASNLAEENNKLLTEVDELKNKLTCKGEDLIKAIDSFKQDASPSYLVGFEAALEQAAVVHPSMDLSELDSGKIVVDGQLRGD